MWHCALFRFKNIDNETDIYYKDTHTGQYVHFSSYTHWNIKTVWIKALYNWATKIGGNQKLLDNQMKKILSFMSWNSFPNYVIKPLLHRLNQVQLYLQVMISLKRTIFLRSFSVFPMLEMQVNSFWDVVWRNLNVV